MLAPFAGAAAPDVDVPDDTRGVLIFTSGTTSAPKAAIRTPGRAGPARPQHRRRVGGHRRRRGVQRDAAVPLQRAVPRHVPDDRDGRHDRPAPAVLGVGVHRRRPPLRRDLLQLRRQAARVHPGHAAARRRRRQPAADRLRQRGQRARHRRFGRRFDVLRRRRLRLDRGRRRHHAHRRTSPPGVARPAAERADRRAWTRRPARSARPPGSTPTAGCSTPSEAIGEIVNKGGLAAFEGYYSNDEANAERTRGGWYWTGDLGYRDEQGFFYFAGRGSDWLRVDGENFAAAPVERIVAAPPRRGARRRVRGARPEHRRPGDARRAARRRRRRSTRRRSGGSSPRRPISARSGCRGSCAWLAGAAGQPHQQDQEGPAAPGGVARRRPDLVPSRPGRRLPAVRAGRCRRPRAGVRRGRPGRHGADAGVAGGGYTAMYAPSTSWAARSVTS